jgi:acyl carrier protein
MVSGALFQPSSPEAVLASKIRAFIAQFLKVDVVSIGVHSHLTDDFGLDLLDITELMIALEEQFGAEGEIMDDAPIRIETVEDLIRHIESSKRALRDLKNS